MCDVYQNAYLTIAAAAAHNSSEGLFHPRPFSVQKMFPTASRNDDKVEEFEIFARPWSSQRHWIDSIGDGPWCRDPNPLEKRAWTLQGHSGIVAPRISASVVQDYTKAKSRSGSSMIAGNNPLQGPRIMDPLIVWLEIIGPFTGRAITHETDRLPALSGVAAALGAFMKTEYIAGMCKDKLGMNICWHVEQAVTSRHEAYYAPTWSWASVIGPVITQLTFHM
ncbi:hypothetical protein NW761_012360 [Fusarium oxysporum]|nr:hypothetical protein NW758_010510 [Fusarium oxysporum]KAJ4076822.1 hypothetical protein NW761_012360 [Fusarium oxysporum]